MFKKIALLLTSITVALTAAPAWSKDSHSYANVDEVMSRHLHLDLTVDFEKKSLIGFAEYDIVRKKQGVNEFVLDTRDLKISKVRGMGHDWQNLDYNLSSAEETLGAKLTVTITDEIKKVRIYYSTSPEASGLQWLTPAQTAGKTHPYVYTESQPVHARSWVPIQDTPALRLTYSAQIRTPKELLAVMSAANDPETARDGVYDFTMTHKIPPYLLALGVGDFHFKAMSHNTGVYAEKYILDAAAAEFSDTAKMITVTEKLYGPYQWGRFDILMMPPSYPMGGMENPLMSFITPTVIAGDKSLVDLIAHELAHSWSGNLVTNASWDDLWLNEGTTSYVENRIMENLYGPERALMEKALSAQSLLREMEDLAPLDTKLHADLDGRDPDEAFSGIPYTKGQLFLIYLEQKYGRAAFDPFLKDYFTAHAFQNMTSEKFVAYLKVNLMDKHPGVVSMAKIKEWIYGQGLPADAPNPLSDIFEKVMDNQNNWLAGKMTAQELPTDNWTVHEWLHFITNFPADMPANKMAELDQVYHLTQSKNNEIAHAWLLQGLKHQYKAITPRLREYLPTIGRLKLIRPLYKQLATTAEGLKLAKEIYGSARAGYHPSAQKVLDRIILE